jgi:transposase, IS5 family
VKLGVEDGNKLRVDTTVVETDVHHPTDNTGFFSENNVAVCVGGGVATVSIPQRGGCKTPQRRASERSPAFKQGQRFRAGIEGRISVLMRGRGMKRCRAEGAERFALFVGAAVLANNLMIIGELLTNRSRRCRKTNRQFLG